MNDEIIMHNTPAPLDKLSEQPPERINIIPRDKAGRFLTNNANPLGRPFKVNTISDQLRAILNLSPEEIKAFKPATGAQEVALMMYKQLKDPQILKELLNRVEGKVTEHIEVDKREVRITYELVKGSDTS